MASQSLRGPKANTDADRPSNPRNLADGRKSTSWSWGRWGKGKLDIEPWIAMAWHALNAHDFHVAPYAPYAPPLYGVFLRWEHQDLPLRAVECQTKTLLYSCSILQLHIHCTCSLCRDMLRYVEIFWKPCVLASDATGGLLHYWHKHAIATCEAAAPRLAAKTETHRNTKFNDFKWHCILFTTYMYVYLYIYIYYIYICMYVYIIMIIYTTVIYLHCIIYVGDRFRLCTPTQPRTVQHQWGPKGPSSFWPGPALPQSVCPGGSSDKPKVGSPGPAKSQNLVAKHYCWGVFWRCARCAAELTGETEDTTTTQWTKTSNCPLIHELKLAEVIPTPQEYHALHPTMTKVRIPAAWFYKLSRSLCAQNSVLSLPKSSYLRNSLKRAQIAARKSCMHNCMHKCHVPLWVYWGCFVAVFCDSAGHAGPLSFAQSVKDFPLDSSMSSQRADRWSYSAGVVLWDPLQDHALLGAPSGPSDIVNPTLHGTLRTDILWWYSELSKYV